MTRLAALALTTVLIASACVTVTPHPRVASAPSPSPTTHAAATIPPPTAIPTVESTATPSGGNASPVATPTAKPSRTPTPTPTPTPTARPTDAVDPGDPACSDDAYTLEGFSWNSIYRWRYNAESTPSGYDADAVLSVIKNGIDNVVHERNDCGRPDTVNAFALYLGKTTLKPCTNAPDGQNTIGWGDIPTDLSGDVIAYTCPVPYGGLNSEYTYEADIVINDKIPWALSKADCFFQELLEPTITHEVGHVFGLGHVSERQHPDLTMSTSSNGTCDNIESTLGLGDMLGLESLYPAN